MDAQGQPLIIPAGTKVKLPYHINPETGSGYEIEVQTDTPEPVFQEEVNRLFPKTLASLATQLLDKDPAAPMLSREDFMEVWKSAQAMDAGKEAAQNKIEGGPSFWQQGGDVLKEAIRSMAEGANEAIATGGEGLHALANFDPNAASKSALRLINGFLTGTGRLMDASAVVGGLAWSKIANDPYAAYSAGKYAQQAEYMRKEQGYGMVGEPAPEDIEAARKIGNILDITIAIPAVSAITRGMTKAGQAVAGQTMEELTKTMAERSVDSLGRRVAGKVLETAGAAAEKVGSLSAVGDSLTRGFLRTEAVRQAAGTATGIGAVAVGAVLPDEGPLSYAGTALKTYGTLRLAQVAGAGAKWAGKILGSEELTSKIVQDALRNAEVQGAERLAVKLIKNIPDPVVRMTRKVMDGAMIPAAIGATLSGAQEASDPFSTPLSIAQASTLGGAAGATVGGMISGAFGIVPEFTGKAAQQSFVREILTDLTTRPQERSFVIGNQDVRIPDDIQNRLNVLNSDTMTTRQKASLFGILDSAEHAGVEVAFINDATPLPDALGGSGANMGKGVKFVNDAGRKTIFVNADQINNTGAIHEVMHAYTSDQVASDFVRNLSKERGGELGAFQELGTMAQRYYDTQVQTNPEAAAQIKANIDRMNDPQIPLQDRLVAATELAHEYIAEGVAQSLADAKPESLQDFRGSAISAMADRAFRGALEKIYTATGMSSVGATHDPISGHFFKDGKIISNAPLADMTKKLRTAINTSRQIPVSPEAIRTSFGGDMPRDVPFVGETMRDGGRVVAIEPRATYEDTHANGALTTEAEKTVYHKAVYNQVAQAMGATNADAVLIQQGVYPGNIKEGTPIIYTDKLTPQNISALFQVQTHHGRPLIAPENREAVARFAQALNDGHLVSVTHSVNVGKSTGKDRAYTARIAQVGLPMAFSQSSGGKGSGPKMEFFNLSLVNDMINLNRTNSRTIDAALRDLKVNSLDDVIPYAKAYIDNLSSTGSVPSARALAAVAPEGVSPKNLEFMRDMLHMSSAVQPRKDTGEVRINEPYMNPEAFRNVPKTELMAVTPQGQKFKTTLSRERRGIQSIRLDGISDVQLYQPNGQPVQVKVNKPELINKIRANWSPATTRREKLPNGEAVTDTATGERMIISPKGKVKLFGADGKLAGVFEDEDAAVLKSNQDKLRANKTARSGGAVGGKAITVAYVSNTLTPGESILNFGAGVPDKQTGKYLHSETLRSAGGNVKEYDFGRNQVGELGEKFDTVFASNVLNVQADKAMLDSTLSQIWNSVGPDGRAVFNYPASPRYLDMRPSEVAAAIQDVTGIAPQRVGGTSSTPLWEVSKKQQVRFSPRRKGETLQEQRAREYQEELNRVGLGREGGTVIGDDATHVEEIVTARNELVREETPTFAGKLGDPELERRLDVSTAVQEAAAAREAVSKKVSEAQRIRKQLQARQAEIQRAVAAKAASGELGPVEVGSPQYKKMFERKTLEDLPGGTSGRVPPTQPSFTLEQFRRAIGNAYVEEFPTPAEVPPAVTDLISQKTPRTEIERRNELARIAETERRAGITHRTVLGSIQSDAANAARVGDMKIEQMLKAMSEKREAMFDAELARVRNKFNTMELQGKAEEARQAGIDPEIVRLRNEHFANVQRQIAQAAEPAPLNSGTPEPPAQTQLPGIATAADDARIPRDIAIQYSRGKFRIWSIGRQAVQAVTETYQEALKKAQAIQLKRRGKQNAA